MYIVGVNKNEVDKMKFSKERARAAADEKYTKETDLMCELLRNKDIQGIKEYLVKYEKQKARYIKNRVHWTRSGAAVALVNDMRQICNQCA